MKKLIFPILMILLASVAYASQYSSTIEEGETQTLVIDGVQYDLTCIAITDAGVVKFQIGGYNVPNLAEGATPHTTPQGFTIQVDDVIPNPLGDVTLDKAQYTITADSVSLPTTTTILVVQEDKSSVYPCEECQAHDTIQEGYSKNLFYGTKSRKISVDRVLSDLM